jgi:hypothetical protein
MSQDRPSINDILLTVQKFLDDNGPKLTGEAKYHAQVSSYLLGICERELRLADGFDAVERDRLARFLGRDGGLAELTDGLCADIRSGALDARWDETLDLVLRSTIDKVRIVRPGHLDPMHRAAPAAEPPAQKALT